MNQNLMAQVRAAEAARDQLAPMWSPVHNHGGKWYYWDADTEHRIGPFPSRDDAAEALAAYVAEADKQPDQAPVRT